MQVIYQITVSNKQINIYNDLLNPLFDAHQIGEFFYTQKKRITDLIIGLKQYFQTEYQEDYDLIFDREYLTTYGLEKVFEIQSKNKTENNKVLDQIKRQLMRLRKPKKLAKLPIVLIQMIMQYESLGGHRFWKLNKQCQNNTQVNKDFYVVHTTFSSLYILQQLCQSLSISPQTKCEKLLFDMYQIGGQYIHSLDKISSQIHKPFIKQQPNEAFPEFNQDRQIRKYTKSLFKSDLQQHQVECLKNFTQMAKDIDLSYSNFEQMFINLIKRNKPQILINIDYKFINDQQFTSLDNQTPQLIYINDDYEFSQNVKYILPSMMQPQQNGLIDDIIRESQVFSINTNNIVYKQSYHMIDKTNYLDIIRQSLNFEDEQRPVVFTDEIFTNYFNHIPTNLPNVQQLIQETNGTSAIVNIINMKLTVYLQEVGEQSIIAIEEQKTDIENYTKTILDMDSIYYNFETQKLQVGASDYNSHNLFYFQEASVHILKQDKQILKMIITCGDHYKMNSQ